MEFERIYCMHIRNQSVPWKFVNDAEKLDLQALKS
jgi:hypothetical protein